MGVGLVIAWVRLAHAKTWHAAILLDDKRQVSFRANARAALACEQRMSTGRLGQLAERVSGYPCFVRGCRSRADHSLMNDRAFLCPQRGRSQHLGIVAC